MEKNKRIPKAGDDPRDYQFLDLVNVYIWRPNNYHLNDGADDGSGVLFKKDEIGDSYFLNQWIHKWSAVNLDYQLSGCGGDSYPFVIISEIQAKKQCEEWGIDPTHLF